MRPELHPACAAFPALPESDLQELAEDIRKNGLLEPITLTPDGLLLDGRCRWDGCEIAGIEPRTTVYAGDDPASFVLSKNKHRRHLSKSQMAMVLARMAKLTRGRVSKTNLLLKEIYSTEHLSKQGDVPVSYINYGKTLLAKAEPHIIKMVDEGGVNVRVAAEAVRHSSDRLTQASWTVEDVEQAGYAVINGYPSNRPGAPKNKKKGGKAATRGPIDIPYKPMVWPTKEELGYPADDAPLSEFDAFFKKHGRTPLHPKAVKELLDADGLSSSLAISVNSITNDRHPDVERFFECVDHMLKHVPELGKTNGAQTDFASKARKTLAMLERALPKALALLNALDAEMQARKADKGERQAPALHLVSR